MKHKAFFIFMTALLIGSPLYAQKYKIALIHSYQEGYSGAGIVNKLFVKGLKDQQIDFQLRTFYLDCEKYESVEEERRISEFADSIRSWGGDLIAVLDDQATYSVMACGKPYVRQVPVVFSGVNYPNQELLAQYPNITGYIDKPDYLTTCRMIERIMGKVRIHILNGRTVLDRLIRKDLSEQCKGLELSRIESGNMSFHCEDCSAHHFAETVYQTHQVIILPPVEFIKEFPDEDVTIHIDRMRLTQVITNFLGNAKKFTSQGHIKLGYFCDKEKKEIHFFVEDTGAGIPKEELQMIFERFYKRNEFVQGVGLGLAISKVIVEKMNGHIDVQSEVNKGSRFTAVLPYL